jgi:WD40 repeat protein
MAINSDNRWLVTDGRDNSALLWDLTTPALAAAPIVLRGHEHWIADVTFSPDNDRLATASWDGTVRLWDLTARNPANEPIVLRKNVERLRIINAVAISPDNRWLVTGNEDGIVRIWPLRLDELVDLACRTAGRNLTDAEREQYFGDEPYRKTCPDLP